MSKFLKECCLCCGTNSLKKKISFENSDLYICKNSCIFSIPKIDTNSIYTPEYFKSYYEDETTASQEKMLVKLTLLLKKYINNGSILDYGCGTGSFLVTAEKHEFTNNIGIDVSEYSTSIAKSRALKSNFYINKENLKSNKFDCLSFIDSIAHIHDINIIFSELISNNLNDDGVILIRTPNINRMYILYSLIVGYIIPKRYLNSLFFLPNRLFLFNIESIELFLNRHGLEIQEFFLEPEFTSIPSKFQRKNFLKSFIVDLIRVKIPNIINKNNSLTLIAKIKA